MICFYYKPSGGGGAPGSTPNAIVEDHFTHASSGDLSGNLPDTVGASPWVADSGLLSYIGGGVAQTTNGAYAVEGGYAPSPAHPLTTQVSVRGGAGSYGGITFRRATGLNYLLFLIYPGGSGWEIDNVTAANYDPLQSGAGVFATSTWHTLKIVDDGSSTDFYVNGNLVQHYATLTLKNTNTQGGLEGGFGAIEFKDFVVTRAP